MTRWTGGRDRTAALQELPVAYNTAEELELAAAYIRSHATDDADLLLDTLGLGVP